MSPALPNFDTSGGVVRTQIPIDPGGSAPKKKKSAPKKKSKRTGSSEAIVQLALELLAVSLFTLMAGASKEMGSLMVLFMIGFWLIYLIQNAKVIAGLERMLESA